MFPRQFLQAHLYSMFRALTQPNLRRGQEVDEKSYCRIAASRLQLLICHLVYTVINPLTATLTL